MAVLMTPPYLQFLDENGDPLAGGKIQTYEAGTDTPKATYTDASGETEHENPVVLDSAGRAEIWLDGSYKFEIYDALDNLIRTVDNVNSFNDAEITNRASVSESDQLPGFLSDKIIAGDKISISIDNPGDDEKLVVSTSGLGTAATKDVGTEVGDVPLLSFVNKAQAANDFSDAKWVKKNCTVTINSTTDPDGGSTADMLVEDTATDMHYVVQRVEDFGIGNKIEYTIYAKTAGRSYAYVAITDAEDSQTNSVSVIVNLANGVTGTLANNGTAVDGSVSVDDEGDGWWKITLSGIVNPSGTSSNPYIMIGGALDLTTPSYEGDGASGIYVWGAAAGMAGLPAVDGSQLVNVTEGSVWVEVGVVEATAATAVIFNNLPEDCTDFVVVSEGLSLTASVIGLVLQFSTNNGDTFITGANTYRYDSSLGTQGTGIPISASGASGAATQHHLAFDIINLSLPICSMVKGIWHGYTLTGQGGESFGVRQAEEAHNAFRITRSTGTFTGKFRVYGRKGVSA